MVERGGAPDGARLQCAESHCSSDGRSLSEAAWHLGGAAQEGAKSTELRPSLDWKERPVFDPEAQAREGSLSRPLCGHPVGCGCWLGFLPLTLTTRF
jgi:hypothetical protein